MFDFDEVYKTKIGEFGYWQKIIFASLGYIVMPGAMQVILASFTQATPKFSCTMSETKKFIFMHPVCESEELSTKCSAVWGPHNNESCNTFEFNHQIYKTTITEDFNLVCDREIYGILLKMLSFFGWSVGANFAGLLADNVGRKNAIIICSLAAFVLDFTGSYANSVFFYGICKFLGAVATMITMIASFVLLMEYSGESIRGTLGMHHTGSIFAGGLCVCTVLGYFIREWRLLQRFVSVFHLPNVVFMVFLEESPRWLMLKGRVLEAKKALMVLGLKNGKGFDCIDDLVFENESEPLLKKPLETDLSEKTNQDSELDLSQTQPDSKKAYSQIDVFRQNTSTTRVTLILMYLWIACALVYYALTMGGAKLPGSIYVNTFILCFVEIPAVFCMQYFLNKYGRRISSSACFLAGAIFCWLSMLSNQFGYCEARRDDFSNMWVVLNLVFSFTGKFFMCGAFAAVWVWTAEQGCPEQGTVRQSLA